MLRCFVSPNYTIRRSNSPKSAYIGKETFLEVPSYRQTRLRTPPATGRKPAPSRVFLLSLFQRFFSVSFQCKKTHTDKHTQFCLPIVYPLIVASAEAFILRRFCFFSFTWDLFRFVSSLAASVKREKMWFSFFSGIFSAFTLAIWRLTRGRSFHGGGVSDGPRFVLRPRLYAVCLRRSFGLGCSIGL